MNKVNGKFEAAKLDNLIRTYLDSSLELSPTKRELAIIQLGEDSGSSKYVALKSKVADSLGVRTSVYKIDTVLGEDRVFDEVRRVCNDPKNSSVIIQIPLPKKSMNTLLDLIPSDKDVDLLSTFSRHCYAQGDSVFTPPVVRAVQYLLSQNKVNVRDKKVLLIGNSFLVGQPLSIFLSRLGASVEITESYSTGEYIDASLVVTSTGIPNLVNLSDVCPNSSVIDFGYAELEGRVVGDVCSDAGYNHLRMFSASPNGVGPLVVRYLIMNHLGI